MIASLCLGASSLAFAQTPAVGGGSSSATSTKIRVADDSKQLTLQGISGQKVSRVVALSVTEDSAPISNLKFVATPLSPTNQTDNARPQPEVTTEPKDIELRPGEPPVQVLVIIPLDNLNQGEFKSVLRLVHPTSAKPTETHVEVEIPMVIKVHHDLRLPLLVLIGGVALGMFFSWFKTSGRDRDVALTGRDALMSIANDATQPSLLTETLMPVTVDVDAAISNADWMAAQAAVKKGEALVFRWRRDRTNWEQLSNYILTFRSELQRYPQESLTIRTINDQSSTKTGELALAETSEPLRNQLNIWRDQLDLFSKTQALLTQLTHLRTQVTQEVASEVSRKESECDDKLKKLSPDDKSGFTSLQADLTEAITKYSALIPPRAVPQEAAMNAEPRQAPSSTYREISAVPGLAARGWQDRFIPTFNWLALGRSYRLKLMGWLGYVFPASVFVYTGFSQLYLANPTFGLLSDYVALFLWGFGSDAGGSKLQDLMRLTNNGAKEAVIEKATNRAAGDGGSGRDAGGTPLAGGKT